jgi:hypothetical protein
VGGYGSGRHWGRVKATTSDYYALDVRRWQRDRLLTPGQSFDWRWTKEGKQVCSIRVRVEFGRVILSYGYRRNDAEPWQPTECTSLLEWMQCNYGGSRPWFRCPARGCDRRAAILYLNGIFACRHCCQLAYNCQREPAHYRALNRAQAIREKLGGSGNMYEVFPKRPRGMHRRTYQRLS